MSPRSFVVRKGLRLRVRRFPSSAAPPRSPRQPSTTLAAHVQSEPARRSPNEIAPFPPFLVLSLRLFLLSSLPSPNYAGPETESWVQWMTADKCRVWPNRAQDERTKTSGQL